MPPITDDDLAELQAWARGEVEAIDWGEICLPPCTDRIRAAADRKARIAAITRAYYDPEMVTPDSDHLDRERRWAAGQVVLVSADGSILATWRYEQGTVAAQYGGRTVAPTRRKRRPAQQTGPQEHGALLRMLRDEGVHVEQTSRHLRVHAPDGVKVYIPSTPSNARGVLNSVALLRKHGCTLRHHS
jgi:hypothetical protein